MSNTKHLVHIKSSALTTSGTPKLPTIDEILYGELAVNFHDSAETISMKNNVNEIVTFSSDEIVKSWLSGMTRVTLNGEKTDDAAFYAPLSGGTSGQTLKAAGEGNAPFWKDEIEVISLTKAEYDALSTEEKNNPLKIYTIIDDGDPLSGQTLEIYINGKKNAHPYFYAPITSGQSGYTIVADENGIPVWTSGASRVNLNGQDTKDAKFYAPVSGGTSGQTLISNGDGLAPEWKTVVNEIILNSKKTADPDFYAPLSGGTSGYTLLSNGVGNAPDWKKTLTSVTLNDVELTDAEFYAPLSGGTSGYTLVSQGDGKAPEWEKTLNKINLNSKDVTDAAFYAPISGGTSGQVLTSKGDGIAPEWTNAAVVTLNDKIVKDPDFYAPLSGGTSGYTLVSQGDGNAPEWEKTLNKINLNEVDVTDAAFYAPLSAGTSGQVLTSVGGGEPKWKDTVNKVILNSKETLTPDFYAPLSGGTSGQTLKAGGDTIAPYWHSEIEVISLTKAEYDALSTEEKNDTWKMYTITDDGDGSGSGSTFELYLNGVKNAHPNFYAPVSAGQSGYTLIADENGIPVWTSGTSRVNLNGDDVTNAKFYAPISGGTEGQLLASKGTGNAPEWTSLITAKSMTLAEYEALTDAEKNNPLVVYLLTDD